MFWGRAKKDAVYGRQVVREAERVLAGRTLESYIARRHRVPAWSLIALLAHSTREDLRRLAEPAAGSDPAGWSGTVARLARGLLRSTEGDADLLIVQRRSLVPLELRLLGGEISPPTSPADLWDMVSGYLDRPLSWEV